MASDLPPLNVSFDGESFVSLPLNSVQSAVMPVVVVHGNWMIGVGTAFTVANAGIMLTAKHVLEAALEHRGDDDDTQISVLYITAGTGYEVPDLMGGPLPVTRAVMSGSADLALLQVALPLVDGKPIRFPALTLSPGFPSVGQRTMALGYSKINARDLKHSAEETAFEISQNFNATDGRISQLHPTRRDSHSMPFPCIETTARYDPGMSGGPVLMSTNGHVCAVVCSAFTTVPDEMGYTSHATLIAPAFDLETCGIDESGNEETVSLLELAQRGVVPVDETLDLLQIRTDQEGTRSLGVRDP